MNLLPDNPSVVGIADMKVSDRTDDVLITYALGSCLGIAIHDPLAHVAGLLHVMLPTAAMNPARARENPQTFVDSGVPLLFRACYELGARKENLIVKVAGGASLQDDPAQDSFQVGRNNLVMLRRLFWKNGILVRAQDVGGRLSRTLWIHVATGATFSRSNGSDREL